MVDHSPADPVTFKILDHGREIARISPEGKISIASDASPAELGIALNYALRELWNHRSALSQRPGETTRSEDEKALLTMEEKIGAKVRQLVEMGDRTHRLDADVEDVLELAAEYANATADARLRWRMATAAEAGLGFHGTLAHSAPPEGTGETDARMLDEIRASAWALRVGSSDPQSEYGVIHDRLARLSSRPPEGTGATDAKLLDEAECIVRPFNAAPPGGQRVGVSSAVLAVHVPTGLAVVENEQRSQMRNKKRAFERLAQLVARSSSETPPSSPHREKA